MRIIVATNNKHKIIEIKNILTDYNIFSLSDLNIDIEPKETGKTFSANAFIKANTIYLYMKEKEMLLDNDIIIADDSGLCIDYLNGEPGINSARFMGDDSSQKIKNKKILELLKDVEFDNRIAKFVTVICMISKNETKYFTGEMNGYISNEIIGENGFGYDPIFYLTEYMTTVANIPDSLKNKISHRANALKLLKSHLNITIF